MIHVQHLLGVGHLQRSLQLAAELARHDFAVDLVSGGRPQLWVVAPGVQFHQLPAAYSPDGSFSRLLDANDNEIEPTWLDNRKQQEGKTVRPAKPERRGRMRTGLSAALIHRLHS